MHEMQAKLNEKMSRIMLNTKRSSKTEKEWKNA